MVVRLFWISMGLVVYAYLGYPLFLLLASSMSGRPVRRSRYVPSVSIIMAVHNEERIITRKLENLLKLDYPRELLEFIVVSDHSTDRTNALVREYADCSIELIEVPRRQGKHSAQKKGIAQSKGEILVFTDAAALLEPNSLSVMMEYFADPEVGCVTSEDRVVTEARHSNAEGLYIRYLMVLRRLESKVGSVVGLSGSYFAARRELCEQWWTKRSSDFAMALRSVQRGLRAVNAADSIHHYAATPDPEKEFQRKVRTLVNGMLVFGDSLAMLNVFRYGFFSVQYLSHKFIRWSVPLFLIVLFVTTAFLARDSMAMKIFLALQSLFYVLATLGYWFRPLTRTAVVRVPFFFCQSNTAVMAALGALVAGRHNTIWTPTQRDVAPS